MSLGFSVWGCEPFPPRTKPCRPHSFSAYPWRGFRPCYLQQGDIIIASGTYHGAFVAAVTAPGANMNSASNRHRKSRYPKHQALRLWPWLFMGSPTTTPPTPYICRCWAILILSYWGTWRGGTVDTKNPA